MYNIALTVQGTWKCSMMIQDGTQRAEKNTRKEAVQWMIGSARAYNGSYIREDDIKFSELVDLKPMKMISSSDDKMLSDIKLGTLVVLSHNDKRIKYRITDRECEIIVAIREGRINVDQH